MCLMYAVIAAQTVRVESKEKKVRLLVIKYLYILYHKTFDISRDSMFQN